MILAIIISATVFVSGLEATGVVKVFIAYLKTAGDAARYVAAFAPFSLAIMMGSADAVVMAINEAITPHAEQFGMSVLNMGNLTHVSGALGRSMSPISAPIMVVSGLAAVSPIEIAKRTAPGMIVALFASMLLLP